MSNMTKEYRAEIRRLKRASRIIWFDLQREIKACDREREKVVRSTARRVEKAKRRVQRESIRIARRVSILEGRL